LGEGIFTLVFLLGGIVLAETFVLANESEKAVLVGIDQGNYDLYNEEDSLKELSQLLSTAGGKGMAVVTQKRVFPDPRFYVGEGKLDEIKDKINEHGCTLVVCDHELSSLQIHNLENELQIKVIDRTQLILDIFAKRAKSKEGKIQVELAQLRYLLPRLVGSGSGMSRLGGGIGTRGPGETKLETDRRSIRRRLSYLRKELKEVQESRALHRKRRVKKEAPIAALVGYTNAGKSTLLCRLTGAEVLVEDKLFATLDPTIRRLSQQHSHFLLVDTVGFINRLPHTLVEAFKATLEEVKEADLLIHVIDISNPLMDMQMQAVLDVLNELRVMDKPIITAFNKIDLVDDQDRIDSYLSRVYRSVAISAEKGIGLENMVEMAKKFLPDPIIKANFMIPYDKMHILQWLHDNGDVDQSAYLPQGVRVKAQLPRKMLERIKEYQLT
jgi:GTP-binding protein HflX